LNSPSTASHCTQPYINPHTTASRRAVQSGPDSVDDHDTTFSYEGLCKRFLHVQVGLTEFSQKHKVLTFSFLNFFHFQPDLKMFECCPKPWKGSGFNPRLVLLNGALITRDCRH
jgi:hypothetical protein